MLPVLIGIAGGTGSGKTTLAKRLVEALPEGEAVLIQHDWYYRDQSHLDPAGRKLINFDEPSALENDLLVADLNDLRAGRGVRCPEYDLATHTRREEKRFVSPGAVVVVEGILLFAVPALCDVLDLRLFIDTDDDIRLLRRMRRDVEERGRDVASVAEQYLRTVRPMHALHVAPSRDRAHLVISDGGEAAIDAIAGRALHLLGRAR